MQLMQMMFQPMMDTKSVDVDPDAQQFRVKATAGGILQMFGLGSKATFSMDANGFRLKKTTFGAEEDTFIPREKIASTVCIVAKPLEFLVLGLALLVVLVGIVFLIAFFLAKKRVIIGVVSTGGTVESLKLKAKGDTLEDIKDGMKIIEELIRHGSSGGESLPASPPPPPAVESRRSRPAPAADSGDTFVTACPSCGTQMNVPAAAAGRKVRCTSCREVFQVPAE